MGGRGASSANTTKLPQLIGTEKQIKWANELRKTVVEIIKKETDVFNKNKSFFEGYYSNELEEYKDFKKYSKEVLKEKKANKWIESFRNVPYRSDYYIKSLEKDKYDSDTGYTMRIRESMVQSAIAYKRFVQN